MNARFYRLNEAQRKNIMVKVRQDFPSALLRIDSSIGWGEDLIPELNEIFPFTVRFDNQGKIRLPAAQRLHLYKGSKPYSTNDNLGYLLLEGFIVCSFGGLERVMTKDIKNSNLTFIKPDLDNLETGTKEYSLGIFSCDTDTIKARKERLIRIYDNISNDSFVSVYLGRSAFIDERPFMKFLADSKKK